MKILIMNIIIWLGGNRTDMEEKDIIKGNNNYFNIHQWIKRNYGKASKCENLNCQYKNPKRFEWALKKGFEYERNLANYIQLCVSCHRYYDFTEEKRKNLSKSKLKGTSNNKPVQVLDIHGNITEFLGIGDAHRKTGVAIQTIYDSINNIEKKWKKKSTIYLKWMYK